MNFPKLLRSGVPCAVVGTRQQFENAIEAFIKCEPVIEQGQPHLSDMHACQKLNFPSVDRCREYGTPGWHDAPLIHFGHYSTQPRKRSEAIEEWLVGKVNKALLDAAATMGDIEFPLRAMPASRESYMEHVMKHGEASLCTPEQIAAGRIDPPIKPTWIGAVRAHVGPLIELADTPSRKILLMKELRKQGLIGKPKKRKRRKWKMLG